MPETKTDIYTEPADIDVDTLANLGPLRALAGTWQGTRGLDVNPKADGPLRQAFVEHIDLQPIDPQANGPQLLYGLRYHSHVVKPGEIETYHDQVGYWLWEPATGALVHTLTIPRGQVVLATGQAAAGATTYTVAARRGSTENGICSIRSSVLKNAWHLFRERGVEIPFPQQDVHLRDSDGIRRLAQSLLGRQSEAVNDDAAAPPPDTSPRA